MARRIKPISLIAPGNRGVLIPANFRLSESATYRLEDLATAHGTTKTAIMEALLLPDKYTLGLVWFERGTQKIQILVEGMPVEAQIPDVNTGEWCCQVLEGDKIVAIVYGETKESAVRTAKTLITKLDIQ